MASARLKAMRKHFKRRMRDRFGMVADKNTIDTLINQIRNGAKFLYKSSGTKSCFKVSLDGKEFAVIYSKKYKTLITAMPLEWVENSRNFYQELREWRRQADEFIPKTE